MGEFSVTFENESRTVLVSSGTLLSEAAQQAGIGTLLPCGGQGRCGRCLVQVLEGDVRRRSSLRLSAQDVASGYALACQTVVEGDVRLRVLPQEKVERRLTTDLTVSDVHVPHGYLHSRDQTLRRVTLSLAPPSLDDQTDDLSRLVTALRLNTGVQNIDVPLGLIRRFGSILRQSEWQVTAILDLYSPSNGAAPFVKVIQLLPGPIAENEPLWGAAIDLGTTTITLWLVDLISGKVRAQAADYNAQIARGEDVISRIIYASKNGAGEEIRNLALETINSLIEAACRQVHDQPHPQPCEISKVVISGNSTMIHLLLNVPANGIRLMPFITTANQFPPMRAQEVGISINPDAIVDCLPGVASFVGSDISAGVFASGMDDSDKITLFMDIGTNGEIVLGSKEWLVTCACSAGPAFEGAGVYCGMRATRGAIEEVWINNNTLEPTYRVIGGVKPSGICGSGLIALLAEMFMTGVIDKAGNLTTALDTGRIREGEHGLEYVVAWGNESAHGRDITITHVDIDNLLRAKGAIYAGYSILAESVGISMDAIERMLIGGSFGKYINVEKAVQIGLLPDLPWERFQFLGNTSVRGAYYALIEQKSRQRIAEIANKMTYIELSADNSFYEAFMSALFLPHTDLERFPSVAGARPASAR